MNSCAWSSTCLPILSRMSERIRYLGRPWPWPRGTSVLSWPLGAILLKCDTPSFFVLRDEFGEPFPLGDGDYDSGRALSRTSVVISRIFGGREGDEEKWCCWLDVFLRFQLQKVVQHLVKVVARRIVVAPPIACGKGGTLLIHPEEDVHCTKSRCQVVNRDSQRRVFDNLVCHPDGRGRDNMPSGDKNFLARRANERGLHFDADSGSVLDANFGHIGARQNLSSSCDNWSSDRIRNCTTATDGKDTTVTRLARRSSCWFYISSNFSANPFLECHRSISIQ